MPEDILVFFTGELADLGWRDAVIRKCNKPNKHFDPHRIFVGSEGGMHGHPYVQLIARVRGRKQYILSSEQLKP